MLSFSHWVIILDFVDFEPTLEFLNDIKLTSAKQKQFKSGHKYNLEKFGLTEDRIRMDCAKVYSTFLN